MKKLGATDAHLDIKGRAGKPQIGHVPAVHNPLIDEVDLGELDKIAQIPAQEAPVRRDINVYLKWAVIIACAILVTLIVMVLKDTA
jgi:hypothetical protein